jgi:hypothetical protein
MGCNLPRPVSLPLLEQRILSMANWKQKLAYNTIGIKGLDRNTADLTIKIDSLEDFFLPQQRIIELHRELIVSAPNQVNTYLVDGKNYLASDWICEVAFLRVLDAFKPLPGDPEITINGVVKTLAEIRPVMPGEDPNGIQWGFDIGDDLLTIGGARYAIRKVNALDWLNEEPASLQLVLKRS